MTTIIVNGKEIKLKGNVAISITDMNATNKTRVKKTPELEKEKDRTIKPIKIYDNVLDDIVEYPRVKDFAMSLGYSKNNKSGLSTIMSVKGVSNRYSNVTARNQQNKKYSVKELNFLDNAIYPILPDLLVDM